MEKNYIRVMVITSIITAIFMVGILTLTSTLAIGNNNIYTRDELSEKVSDANLFLASHPIGSEYSSYDSTNPSSTYGGTWIQTSADYDKIEVGSQVLHDGLSGNGIVAKTSFLSVVSDGLLAGLFLNLNTPVGYHREYRLSFQVRTSSSNTIKLYLNNIETTPYATWSDDNYRLIISTNYFKESDIIMEATYEEILGINLSYEVTSPAGIWQFWNVTIHGFYVSDNILYKWQRTS